MIAYKPKHYNSVSPYLIVDGAGRLVELLQKIFDAQILRRYDRPDGAIMHIEVRIDDTVIMITDSSLEYKATKSMMHVYVPDAHASFEKAVSLGCKILNAPEVKPGDPDLRGNFYDFSGNLWSVSTQTNEV